MPEETFYYADTDENGVLCVDRLPDDFDWTIDSVAAALASEYPDTIYFSVQRPKST